MKKMLFAALAIGLMSNSAMAGWFEGTVGKINAIDNGRFVVEIKLADGTTSPYKPLNLMMGNEAKKQMIAVILTAKASNSPIKMFLATLPTGEFWTRTILP